MPLAADPESTLGHYNKQRGPTEPRNVESRGGEPLSNPLWGNNLDTVICLSYTRLRPTDTHTLEEAGRALQSPLCCYDTALKELIGRIKKY